MSAFLQAIAKYSPDQPRDPKGSPTGGQWTDSASTPDSKTERVLKPNKRGWGDPRISAFWNDLGLMEEWLSPNSVHEFMPTSKGGAGVSLQVKHGTETKASPDIVEIHWLIAEGRGSGRAAMEKLVAEADQHGVRLSCWAVPLKGQGENAGFKMSKAKLEAWYEGFGFTHTKRDRDGFAYMLRKPEKPISKFDPDQPRAPKGTEEGGRWVKDWSAYMTMAEGAQLVDVAQLRPTKRTEENEARIQRAMGFFEQAQRGEIERRGPLLVEQQANGTYLVLNGNSTYKAAKRIGLQQVPVIVAPAGGVKKYDPSQPRAPKGSPDGGQWVSVYHGTLVEYVDGIAKEGLKLKRTQRLDAPGLYKGPRGKSVFVTTDESIALKYGQTRGLHQGKRLNERKEPFEWAPEQSLPMWDYEFAVLHFRVPAELAAQFKEDRFSDGSYRFEGEIPAHYLKDYSVITWGRGEGYKGVKVHEVRKGETVDLYCVLLGESVAKFDPDQPRAPKGSPEGGQWTADPYQGPAFSLKKTRAGDGVAHQIMVNGTRVGHISGFERSESFKEGGEWRHVNVFEVYKTELSHEPMKGTGLYRQALQQVADQYSGGAYTKDWWSSTALKKSIRKMPTFEQVDDRMYVRPSIKKYDPSQPRHPAGSSEGGRWADSVGVPTAYDADADMQGKWDSYLHRLPRTEKPAELSESDMPEELAAALQDMDDHNREQSAPRQGPQTITIETWEYKRPNVRGSAQLPVIFNPTQQELKRWAGREIDTVRFLNTPQGRVFWDALEALHQQVARATSFPYSDAGVPDYKKEGEIAVREIDVPWNDYLFPKLSKSASFMRRVMSLLKFDPAQPRHPKGTPEGGQWAGDTRGPSIPSIEDFSDESMAPGQPMPAKFYAFRLAFDPETRDREPWLYAGKLRGVLSHWASMDEKNLPAGDYLTLYEITPGPDAVWGEYRARMNQYVHLSLPADSKAGYWQGGVSVPPMVPRRLVSSVPINEVATLGDWWDGKLTITREELMARLLDGQSRALLKFDESKVNRGKTTPESNDGSFAPKGESVHREVSTHIQEVLSEASSLRPSFSVVRPKVVFSRRSGVEYDPFDDEMRFPAYGADKPLAVVDREYDSKNPKGYVAGAGIRAFLLHEYAHAIDHYIRRGVTDDDFLTEWHEAKKSLRSEVGYPTEYAKENLSEWVAEQFLWEVLGNSEPRLLDLLDQFVQSRTLRKFDESKVNRHPAGTPVDETTGVGGGRFAPKITTPRGIGDIKDDLYAIGPEQRARINGGRADAELAQRFNNLRAELKAARASANLETSRKYIADTSEVPGPISADLDALLLLAAQDEAEETVAREMAAIFSPSVIGLFTEVFLPADETMPYKGGVATQYGIPAGDSEQYRMANAYGDERLEKDNRAWSEALDQYIGPDYDDLNDFGRLGNGSPEQVQAAHLQERVPILMGVYLSPADHTGTYSEYLREISMQDREVIEHGAAFTEARQSFNARQEALLEQVKLEAFEDRTMTAPVRNQRFVELVGQDSELVRLSQLQLDAETRVTARRVTIEDSLRAIGAQNDPGFRAFAEEKARAIALLTAPPKTTASAYHNIMDLISSRPPTTQPLVTYRGVKSGESINWDKLKPGDTFNLGGFTSTSSMLAAAKRFGRRMMYVYVPEGSRGVLTTTNDREGEILINHGTQMQVLHQTNSKLFLKYIGGQS